MMALAERNRIEVARLALPVSVTDDVVSVRRRGRAADNARQHFNAPHVFYRARCVAFRLRLFQP